MMEPLVSVIIPVYKTEQYLADCVHSVVEQDYPQLEIILVDDGSPDDCPNLCDDYARRYANVSVLHKQNEGLGLARNSGLKLAKGAYVSFVDSDDKLDGPHAISAMVERAMALNADITMGAFRRFDGQTISGVNHHHLSDSEDTRALDFRFRGFCQYGHLAYSWGKLFRTAFLVENELWQRPYPYTQDRAHAMDCYAFCPKYAFLDESVYLYRVNEASVTFRYKKNYAGLWKAITTDFQAFMDKHGITEDLGDLIAFQLALGSFFMVKQELAAGKGMRSAVREMRAYGQEPLVKQFMSRMAGGRYVRGIRSGSWRVTLQGTAILFKLHLYWVYVAGIALLRRFQVDSRVSGSRYHAADAEKDTPAD